MPRIIILCILFAVCSAADDFQKRCLYYGIYEQVCPGGHDEILLKIDIDDKGVRNHLIHDGGICCR